jgi:hypothetical protein
MHLPLLLMLMLLMLPLLWCHCATLQVVLDGEVSEDVWYMAAFVLSFCSQHCWQHPDMAQLPCSALLEWRASSAVEPLQVMLSYQPP